MAQLIELPHVGESVVEGTIGKWLKQPGDRVERYDPLVEVVTDKVTMEVPSPVSGELLRIIAQEGETVPMGAPIAEVDARRRRVIPQRIASRSCGASAGARTCPVCDSARFADSDVVPHHRRPAGGTYGRFGSGSAEPGSGASDRTGSGGGSSTDGDPSG